MPPLSPTDLSQRSAIAVFFAGFRAAWRSVMAYVVIGTYVGIGALTHDFGFGLPGPWPRPRWYGRDRRR